MAGNRIICVKNKVDYITIRMAMCENARTKAELRQLAGVCLECEGCQTELDKILHSVCSCKEVSLQTVVDAVLDGADTVEKVGIATQAGTGEDCGRCKILIENIIALGR